MQVSVDSVNDALTFNTVSSPTFTNITASGWVCVAGALCVDSTATFTGLTTAPTFCSTSSSTPSNFQCATVASAPLANNDVTIKCYVDAEILSAIFCGNPAYETWCIAGVGSMGALLNDTACLLQGCNICYGLDAGNDTITVGTVDSPSYTNITATGWVCATSVVCSAADITSAQCLVAGGCVSATGSVGTAAGFQLCKTASAIGTQLGGVCWVSCDDAGAAQAYGCIFTCIADPDAAGPCGAMFFQVYCDDGAVNRLSLNFDSVHSPVRICSAADLCAGVDVNAAGAFCSTGAAIVSCLAGDLIGVNLCATSDLCAVGYLCTAGAVGGTVNQMAGCLTVLGDICAAQCLCALGCVISAGRMQTASSFCSTLAIGAVQNQFAGCMLIGGPLAVTQQIIGTTSICATECLCAIGNICAGSCIVSSGDIIAGADVCVAGNVCAAGNICSTADLCAAVDVCATMNVCAGGDILAQGNVCAATDVCAGGSIKAQGDVCGTTGVISAAEMCAQACIHSGTCICAGTCVLAAGCIQSGGNFLAQVAGGTNLYKIIDTNTTQAAGSMGGILWASLDTQITTCDAVGRIDICTNAATSDTDSTSCIRFYVRDGVTDEPQLGAIITSTGLCVDYLCTTGAIAVTINCMVGCLDVGGNTTLAGRLCVVTCIVSSHTCATTCLSSPAVCAVAGLVEGCNVRAFGGANSCIAGCVACGVTCVMSCGPFLSKQCCCCVSIQIPITRTEGFDDAGAVQVYSCTFVCMSNVAAANPCGVYFIQVVDAGTLTTKITVTDALTTSSSTLCTPLCVVTGACLSVGTVLNAATCIVSAAFCVTGQYDLPAADGTGGDLICTDGAGNWVYAAPAGVVDQNLYDTLCVAGSGENSAATTTDVYCFAGGTNITAVNGTQAVTFNLDNDVTLSGDLTAAQTCASGYLCSAGAIGATKNCMVGCLVVGGEITASFTGALTGNADTATALETARDINGVAFDGTGDITVTAAAGTLTDATLNSSVIASSLTSVGTLTSLTLSGDLCIPAGNNICVADDQVFGGDFTATQICATTFCVAGQFALPAAAGVAGCLICSAGATWTYADPAGIADQDLYATMCAVGSGDNTAASTTDVFCFVGGTDITVTNGTDAITFAYNGDGQPDQDLYLTMCVAGSGDNAAAATTDVYCFAGGTNITAVNGTQAVTFNLDNDITLSGDVTATQICATIFCVAGQFALPAAAGAAGCIVCSAGATWTYADPAGLVDQNLYATMCAVGSGDNTAASITDVFCFVGGTDITVTNGTDAITFAYNGDGQADQNLYSTMCVAGSGDNAAATTTDVYCFAGGTNITAVNGTQAVTFNLDNDVTLSGDLTAAQTCATGYLCAAGAVAATQNCMAGCLTVAGTICGQDCIVVSQCITAATCVMSAGCMCSATGFVTAGSVTADSNVCSPIIKASSCVISCGTMCVIGTGVIQGGGDICAGQCLIAGSCIYAVGNICSDGAINALGAISSVVAANCGTLITANTIGMCDHHGAGSRLIGMICYSGCDLGGNQVYYGKIENCTSNAGDGVACGVFHFSVAAAGSLVSKLDITDTSVCINDKLCVTSTIYAAGAVCAVSNIISTSNACACRFFAPICVFSAVVCSSGEIIAGDTICTAVDLCVGRCACVGVVVKTPGYILAALACTGEKQGLCIVNLGAAAGCNAAINLGSSGVSGAGVSAVVGCAIGGNCMSLDLKAVCCTGVGTSAQITGFVVGNLAACAPVALCSAGILNAGGLICSATCLRAAGDVCVVGNICTSTDQVFGGDFTATQICATTFCVAAQYALPTTAGTAGCVVCSAGSTWTYADPAGITDQNLYETFCVAGSGNNAAATTTDVYCFVGGTNITAVNGTQAVTFNLDNDVTLSGDLTAVQVCASGNLCSKGISTLVGVVTANGLLCTATCLFVAQCICAGGAICGAAGVCVAGNIIAGGCVCAATGVRASGGVCTSGSMCAGTSIIATTFITATTELCARCIIASGCMQSTGTTSIRNADVTFCCMTKTPSTSIGGLVATACDCGSAVQEYGRLIFCVNQSTAGAERGHMFIQLCCNGGAIRAMGLYRDCAIFSQALIATTCVISNAGCIKGSVLCASGIITSGTTITGATVCASSCVMSDCLQAVTRICSQGIIAAGAQICAVGEFCSTAAAGATKNCFAGCTVVGQFHSCAQMVADTYIQAATNVCATQCLCAAGNICSPACLVIGSDAVIGGDACVAGNVCAAGNSCAVQCLISGARIYAIASGSCIVSCAICSTGNITATNCLLANGNLILGDASTNVCMIACVGAGTFFDIYLCDADGSDDHALRIGGGGDVSNTRGGLIELAGNEYTNTGIITLSPGSVCTLVRVAGTLCATTNLCATQCLCAEGCVNAGGAVCAETFVASPILCSGGVVNAAGVICSATCVRAAVVLCSDSCIHAGDCIVGEQVCGTSCVIGAVVCSAGTVVAGGAISGTTISGSARVCSGTCIVATTCIKGATVCSAAAVGGTSMLSTGGICGVNLCASQCVCAVQCVKSAGSVIAATCITGRVCATSTTVSCILCAVVSGAAAPSGINDIVPKCYVDAQAGGAGTNTECFTAVDSFAVPAGVDALNVTLMSAGGGGSGGSCNGSGDGAGGGGGGAILSVPLFVTASSTVCVIGTLIGGVGACCCQDGAAGGAACICTPQGAKLSLPGGTGACWMSVTTAQGGDGSLAVACGGLPIVGGVGGANCTDGTDGSASSSPLSYIGGAGGGGPSACGGFSSNQIARNCSVVPGPGNGGSSWGGEGGAGACGCDSTTGGCPGCGIGGGGGGGACSLGCVLSQIGGDGAAGAVLFIY